MSEMQQSSGQRDTEARKALEARAAFASEFAEWLDAAPTPPQTTARTINDAIRDICNELNRIAACYDLNQAVKDLQDHQTMYDDDADSTADSNEVMNGLKESMERLGCSRIL